ncbi:iron-containing alcohol dehydrogenase [Veillonella sp. YH-vei2232]|uniref:Iron-containing alcohol dehydrogenase n=1 Tax=Veillonella absiana TaxID=3079305 RepID=A0ABU3Z652_9FIRM|nr:MULTISPECIES: iron-containing alcohol dehydrogenase [unclassified Veillonella]MDV5063348.1 iron-containing alcohol dehydrogenase [Veillonella sp. YH-vei2232]MDV5087384.1 iron-containing alcohol dehydrogenase [Veillonella sp. YH-vei2233]
MNDFIFQNTTKIYFGKDQLGHLGEEVGACGTRVLLVYGGGSIKANGIYDDVMAELEHVGAEVFELSGVEPNPRHTTVNKGADICKREGIDMILAVGGGSTIDCAKAIAAATFYDGDSWDLVIGKAAVTNALPIVTVLTLAATGSEMDPVGVISNIETNEKYGIGHSLLQPKVSFLNPEYTFTVNAYQTASGSVDIMAHVFDMMYFTMKPKFDMIHRMATEVLSTVIQYAPLALKEPANYEARANLMWASSWALNGFLGRSGDFPTCHKIEHELSAYYDITHGHGLAIIIPHWLTYILTDETAPQIKKMGVDLFNTDESLNDIDGAKVAIAALSTFFFDTLGLDSKLSDLGISDKDFKAMARNAAKGGTLKGFIELTPEDIEKILIASL